jgi:HTH-type transcriptional regulator, glycine betaine synthesis regulator
MSDIRAFQTTKADGETPLSPQEQMEEITREFVNNLGRVADFFGFNRLIGQLYAILFISPEPLTLDDMVERLHSSKGNVSINIRTLERLGLVRQIYKWADRKNYYEAETDIWKAVGRILQDRERKEAQQISDSIDDSLRMLEKVSKQATGTAEGQLADFYLQRLEMVHRLFEFGGALLDIMVQGGSVDFSAVAQLSQLSDMKRKTKSGQPLDELNETETT